MEVDVIRQENWASQKDELRNTILRAKNASPVKPIQAATSQSAQAVVAETESSVDEGPLAKILVKSKVSPIPPSPERKQLVSRPATRTPLPPLEYKKPVKARGTGSRENDPLSKAVSNIRKNSLSKISQEMFSGSGVNIKSEGGAGRRVVTSSNVLDLAGEKLVLVEEPNWEVGAGKVRARIGGDDAEGEESTLFAPSFLVHTC
jgi:hypothetical protein